MHPLHKKANTLEQAQTLIEVALDILPYYGDVGHIRVTLSGCRGDIARKANEARAEHRNEVQRFGNTPNAWMEH